MLSALLPTIDGGDQPRLTSPGYVSRADRRNLGHPCIAYSRWNRLGTKCASWWLTTRERGSPAR